MANTKTQAITIKGVSSDDLRFLNNDYDQKYGFRDPEKFVLALKKGLSREVIEAISKDKNEPAWMREFRLRSYEVFKRKPMPKWGGDLSGINFDEIKYYLKPSDRTENKWEDVPADIKKTFDRLGIPEAEQKFLGGVTAQYESNAVYHSVRKDLEEQGVVFLDTDTALKKHEGIFRKWFGKIVPPEDNKFAALNSAVWSGGSFIYIPEGVHVKLPLQAYFRINAQNMGQFERTLIIADKGADVTYVEGCLPDFEEVSCGDLIRSIPEIKLHDKVLNSDGKETEVAKLTRRVYTGDLVEITPMSTGNKFYLTPEHPVLAIKRDRVRGSFRKNGRWPDIHPKKLPGAEPKFAPAGELAPGDLLVFPINQVVVDDPSLSDDFLSLLGYYVAEGCATKINKCDALEFTLGEHEKENIEELCSLVELVTGKKPSRTHDRKKHAVNIVVYSKEATKLMVEHGGKYAEHKRFSKKVMGLPPERQSLALKTYYKGDGSISREGNLTRVRAATISRQLAFQVQELLARRGIYACINVREAFEEKMKDGHVVRHKKKYTLFYAENTRSKRAKRRESYFLVPIRRVGRQSYGGLVYNFEVSGEPNTYLVKGFAVHNCTAPKYSTNSLHSAVVELVALEGARIRYTTIQNWSSNIYNLVTKRAHAYRNATVEWIDGNLGSKLTMKYPSVYMLGENAKADILSVAFAAGGQHQDAGAKVVHLAPNTQSRIISKSISKDGGRTSYRGLVYVKPGCTGVRSNVRCDALILDEASRSDTYPTMEIGEEDTTITHEATVGKISEEQIFYLQSRGLSENEAYALVVLGFIEQFTKELPMEYSLELNRLIEHQMEGSVG